MTRPWEEEWSVRADGRLHIHAVINTDLGITVSHGDPLTEELRQRTIARNRLASAAPDMARALLAVEWSGWDEVAPCCPSCQERQDDGHLSDCGLDAALRKAGVR